jgi:hypothetical protein
MQFVLSYFINGEYCSYKLTLNGTESIYGSVDWLL